MTQWGYDDNDNAGQDNSNELTGPKALRDAYEAQKKILADMQAEVTALREERQKEKLGAVFESLGVPGAASLYKGEADPQKAKEWVETMRSTFGGGNQGGTPPVADSQPPALEPDAQAQYQRMTEAGQQGVPLGNMDAAFAAVGDANNINDLIAGFSRAQQMG